MKWEISYFDEAVEETVLDLPDPLLAKYIWLIEVIQEHGHDLGMPHT